jgi:pullulanase
MTSATQVHENLRFLETPSGVVAYTLDGSAVGDSWKYVLVIMNGNFSESRVTLPPGVWQRVDYDGVEVQSAVQGSLKIKPSTLAILYKP